VFIVAFATVGALLMWKCPSNPIGSLEVDSGEQRLPDEEGFEPDLRSAATVYAIFTIGALVFVALRYRQGA
jgi:hypothetical protein